MLAKPAMHCLAERLLNHCDSWQMFAYQTAYRGKPTMRYRKRMRLSARERWIKFACVVHTVEIETCAAVPVIAMIEDGIDDAG